MIYVKKIQTKWIYFHSVQKTGDSGNQKDEETNKLQTKLERGTVTTKRDQKHSEEQI